MKKLNLKESSNIEYVGYDGKNLTVEFKGGQEYIYFDVPEQIALDWELAESAGKYFHAHVRNSFKYLNIDEYNEEVTA